MGEATSNRGLLAPVVKGDSDSEDTAELSDTSLMVVIIGVEGTAISTAVADAAAAASDASP